MTKQEKTALNMAKFIQAQTLLLLEKLNELNLDTNNVKRYISRQKGCIKT